MSYLTEKYNTFEIIAENNFFIVNKYLNAYDNNERNFLSHCSNIIKRHLSIEEIAREEILIDLFLKKNFDVSVEIVKFLITTGSEKMLKFTLTRHSFPKNMFYFVSYEEEKAKCNYQINRIGYELLFLMIDNNFENTIDYLVSKKLLDFQGREILSFDLLNRNHEEKYKILKYILNEKNIYNINVIKIFAKGMKVEDLKNKELSYLFFGTNRYDILEIALEICNDLESFWDVFPKDKIHFNRLNNIFGYFVLKRNFKMQRKLFEEILFFMIDYVITKTNYSTSTIINIFTTVYAFSEYTVVCKKRKYNNMKFLLNINKCLTSSGKEDIKSSILSTIVDCEIIYERFVASKDCDDNCDCKNEYEQDEKKKRFSSLVPGIDYPYEWVPFY